MRILILLLALTGCSTAPIQFDANIDCPLLRLEYEIKFHEMFSSEPTDELQQEYDDLKVSLERC